MNKQVLNIVYGILMGILATLVLTVLLAAGNDGPMEIPEFILLLVVSAIAVGTTVMVSLIMKNNKPNNKPPRTIERDGVKYWTYND